MTNKFENWLNNLGKIGKTKAEIRQILAGIANNAGLTTYEAIMASLTEEDMDNVEKITNEDKAKETIEELFEKRTGMTIDELVDKVQLLVFENTIYRE